MARKKLFSIFLALYGVLGTWKGYVALFDKGKDEPRQIFPNTVASLPPEDQAALENCIVVRNDRQLQQPLDAYVS